MNNLSVTFRHSISGHAHYAVLSNGWVVYLYNIITTDHWIGSVWEPNDVDHSTITSRILPEAVELKAAVKGYRLNYYGSLCTRRGITSVQRKELCEVAYKLIRMAFQFEEGAGKQCDGNLEFFGEPTIPVSC